MKILSNYFKLILLNFILIIIFRLLETVLIIFHNGYQDSLFLSEGLGILFDILVSTGFLIILYPVYYTISKKISEKVADLVYLSIILLLSVLHFIILKYFLIHLNLLDTFLYEYSLNDILIAVNNSGISYIKTIILLIIVLVISYSIYWLLKKNKYLKQFIVVYLSLFIISVPLFIIIYFSDSFDLNKFSKNKSLFFYARTGSYFLLDELSTEERSRREIKEFQELIANHQFIGKDYPLLHKFENSDVLEPYFEKFDGAPNIVILIVEGLNDDFIQRYRGINLMPFLSNLKSKSLYWNNCFTLGDGAFAAIPAIVGSLPHGMKGFTLLDKLPRHFSLVSVLNANDYHTSFFYGQGSWLDQKDRYLKYNNLDLIFDNNRFDKIYKKIIIGDDHFFWGYNDKDLFNQSFKIIDSLPSGKRFDLYFTGTSNSPFIISDTDYYDNKYTELMNQLKIRPDIDFFTTYKKYLQSVIYVDDALEDFFGNYSKREDFENTLFIITGDHPISEIPVENGLKKYHVPLMFYSPKLKGSKTFSNVVSHLDIYETLLSFISSYNIKVPLTSTALGSKLDVGENEKDKKIVFMNNNHEMIDYYSNGYFLSGQQLYKVGFNLSLRGIIDNKVKEQLQKELGLFTKVGNLVCINDKILPDSIYCGELGLKIVSSFMQTDTIKFNSEYHNILETTEINNGKNYFDVYFDYVGKTTDIISLVYQLSTKNDSIIYWSNADISPENNFYQTHVELLKQPIPDSTLVLKSYFWNQGQKEFVINYMKVLLYEE